MVLDCDNGLIHNDFVGHQHLTLNSIWKIRTLDTPREASPKGCPGGGGGGRLWYLRGKLALNFSDNTYISNYHSVLFED